MANSYKNSLIAKLPTIPSNDLKNLRSEIERLSKEKPKDQNKGIKDKKLKKGDPEDLANEAGGKRDHNDKHAAGHDNKKGDHNDKKNRGVPHQSGTF